MRILTPIAATAAASTSAASTSAGMAGMGMGQAPPLDLHTYLTDWPLSAFSLAVAVVLVATAVWYLASVRRLASRGRGWSAWRTASFVAGLGTVEVALGSPVAGLAGYSFTAHIIQHLLLMILAPPLAALGAPMTLLLQTSSRRTKGVALRALHSPPFALLSHPVVVFFLYYLSMYAFFLSGALGFAMGHPWVMDGANIGFAVGATLFWWPMIGLDPIPRGAMSPGLKVINMMIGIPIESFLGIALLTKTAPVASMYTVVGTHTGGGVLWAASEVATIVALAPIYVQWVRSDARRARRIDARLDAGEVAPVPDFEGRGMAATLKALRRG